MEFELTRHNNLDGPMNFTVTACFRMPVREHIMEAWRVLIKACRPNALLSTVVDENTRKAIAVMGRLDELAKSASKGTAVGGPPARR